MQLIAGLVVAAVLLLAVIVIFATQSSGTPPAATEAGAPTNSASTDMTGKTNAGTGMSADAAGFDPATATKVPANQTPAAFVEAYYKASAAGDYQSAYQYLPAAKKQSQSEADFATQLKGYGITGYKMGATNESDVNMTVEADQVTAAYGTFTSIWTFVKQDGVWLLKSKAVTGMQQ
ncbi:MAG: hypothetical protein FWC54_00795 [Actinomycetia bacterium]|nr:hypothetical protein [Actinomycetes bacterium]